ncbi:3851_t:CDS:1, partial [Dentiscutata heterogama]
FLNLFGPGPDFSWLGLIVEGKCFLGGLVELIQLVFAFVVRFFV